MELVENVYEGTQAAAMAMQRISPESALKALFSAHMYGSIRQRTYVSWLSKV
jgi:hypothetical protein